MKTIPFDINQIKAGAKCVTDNGQDCTYLGTLKGNIFPHVFAVDSLDGGKQSPWFCNDDGAGFGPNQKLHQIRMVRPVEVLWYNLYLPPGPYQYWSTCYYKSYQEAKGYRKPPEWRYLETRSVEVYIDE